MTSSFLLASPAYFPSSSIPLPLLSFPLPLPHLSSHLFFALSFSSTSSISSLSPLFYSHLVFSFRHPLPLPSSHLFLSFPFPSPSPFPPSPLSLSCDSLARQQLGGPQGSVAELRQGLALLLLFVERSEEESRVSALEVVACWGRDESVTRSLIYEPCWEFDI